MKDEAADSEAAKKFSDYYSEGTKKVKGMWSGLSNSLFGDENGLWFTSGYLRWYWYNHKGMEFMTLKSMLDPWNALFLSLPLVFLKESPLVSFSFS